MSGERILIVDDSQQIISHLAEHVLPTFGFKTLTALDGHSGLDLIRNEKPDLVMLDLNLPDLTGIDVLQTLVQESLDVPVVLMTGYGSEKSAIEAFRLGARDYIIKPFSVDEVLETINRALLEGRLRHDKQQLAEQLRRAHVEMRRRVNEMSTLFGIGKAVTSLLSVNKILDRVLEAAMYVSNASESTIWLLDRESEQLRAHAKKGSRTVEPQVYALSDKDAQVVQVLRTGRPIRESAFSGEGIRIKTGYLARAVLFVPLTLRGEAIGVLSVSNSTEPRPFGERDEFLLSALADYAAIALENARVFQATDQALATGNEELRTLIQVTRTITSSLDLEEVVRLAIQQVHDSWQIEASSIWLLDDTTRELRVVANVGTPTEILSRFRLPLGLGFAGQSAQTGESIFVNDVAGNPLHYGVIDQETGFSTRSLLCAPLIYREQVIGVLQLLNKQDGEFDESDVDRATSIATALAIGVSNARLFEQAESRQKQLEATLEHNGNPIVITDADGTVLLLNQQARSRLGLTRRAIGQQASDVVEPEELAAFLTRPLGSQATHSTEIVLPDKSEWLATLAPIPSYGRVIILQDVTYLKELERSKSSFVATVSHDLRAPMGSIRGFAEAIEDAGPLNDAQKQLLSRIIRSSNRMMDLVGGLLDLARISSRLEQAHRPSDIVNIAREAAADLHGQVLAKKIRLEIGAQDGAYVVLGDSTQLRQAIRNLIDNAIKYSPHGSEVGVNVSSHEHSVLVEVHDNGVGISAADMGRVFDQFYRVRDGNSAEGIGLGLTLVRTIAEAHGGRVWLESQEGVGSTFTLKLPMAERDAPTESKTEFVRNLAESSST